MALAANQAPKSVEAAAASLTREEATVLAYYANGDGIDAIVRQHVQGMHRANVLRVIDQVAFTDRTRARNLVLAYGRRTDVPPTGVPNKPPVQMAPPVVLFRAGSSKTQQAAAPAPSPAVVAPRVRPAPVPAPARVPEPEEETVPPTPPAPAAELPDNIPQVLLQALAAKDVGLAGMAEAAVDLLGKVQQRLAEYQSKAVLYEEREQLQARLAKVNDALRDSPALERRSPRSADVPVNKPPRPVKKAAGKATKKAAGKATKKVTPAGGAMPPASVVREWAKKQGYEISEYGRISPGITAEYLRARQNGTA